MLSTQEFRLGHLSLPADDADALPEVCCSCPYLYSKEFSIGEGFVYLCCGYLAAPRGEGDLRPNCQAE